MTTPIDAIRDKIALLETELETELEAELEKRRAGFGYSLQQGWIKFEDGVARQHRKLRTNLWRYVTRARPLVLLTAPVIYSAIVPLALLDLWVSIYQAICFRAYGIPQVKRSAYLIFDRAGLHYLNAVEKLNCAYCSYANGVIAYVREVASKTEQYWCPIKHAKRVLGAHARYAGFEEYGAGERYHERLKHLRAALRNERDL